VTGAKDTLIALRKAISLGAQEIAAIDNFAPRDDIVQIAFMISATALTRVEEVLDDLIDTLGRLGAPTRFPKEAP
jgi:hypothetical protein